MKQNQYSTINIPIRLNLDALENSINQKMQGVLYEDDGRGKDKEGLAIKASKNGRIRLAIYESKIHYQVPLHLWVRKDLGITGMAAEGTIVLHFQTDYTIAKDWNLTTNTHLVQYQWKEQPVLKLGFVDVPIHFIADQIVKRSQLTMTRMIDGRLKNHFSLPNYARLAREQLRQPILLEPNLGLYLHLEVQQIGMTPLEKKEDHVQTIIVVKALLSLHFGKSIRINYPFITSYFSDDSSSRGAI